MTVSANMQGLSDHPILRNGPKPCFDAQGRLWICVDRESVETKLAQETDPYKRGKEMERYHAALEYAKNWLPCFAEDEKAMLSNMSLPSSLAMGKSCRLQKLLELPCAGNLATIVNSILYHKLFEVLGPVDQQRGPITDNDCRFICLFCHKLTKKTSDMWVHLRKAHRAGDEEIKELFEGRNPSGLRVFGQYTYANVQQNRWNIRDWRKRKSQNSQAAQNLTKQSRCTKRKDRGSGGESDEVERMSHRLRLPPDSIEQINCSPHESNIDPQLLSFTGTTLNPDSDDLDVAQKYPFDSMSGGVFENHELPELPESSLSSSMELDAKQNQDILEVGSKWEANPNASTPSSGQSSILLSGRVHMSPALPLSPEQFKEGRRKRWSLSPG